MKNDKQKNNKSQSDQKKLAKAYAKRNKAGTIGPMQMLGSIGGGIGGFMLGGPAGAAAGASAGGALGNLAGYYTGSGDYSYRGGNVVNAEFRNPTSTIVTHREYITDVTSGSVGFPATSFDISTYPINPGSSRTFPWLSSIAANYEQYEILGMVFTFIATSGESVASSNTSLGTVVLATEYDPTKPAFTSKQAMENYQFSSSAKPSVSQVHAIECKKSISPVKQLYVRSGSSAPVGADLRWSDFGNFYIATVGMQQTNVNLGELWCTYKVKLLKPRLPATIGLGGQIASGYLLRTGVTSALSVGTTTVQTTGSIPITVFNNNIAFPVLPGQKYLVTYCARAGTAASWTSNTGFNNLIAVLRYNGGTSANQIGAPANQVLVYNILFQSVATDTDSLGSFDLGVAIIGSATAEITVTQVDSSY